MCKNSESLQLASNPAKVLLDEVMHLFYVASGKDDIGRDTHITDYVYGGYLSAYLATVAPDATLINADSYAYIALSAYMNEACEQPETMFYQKKFIPGMRNPATMPMGKSSKLVRCKMAVEATVAVSLPISLRTCELMPNDPSGHLMSDETGVSQTRESTIEELRI